MKKKDFKIDKVQLLLALSVAAIVLVGVLLMSGFSTSKTIELDNGLVITEIGKYSGEFVEDGSDESVNDVMMITVKNTTSETLQYTEIVLTDSFNNEVRFALSTLPANEEVVVLEKDRKTYSKKYKDAKAEYTVFFDSELSTYSDTLTIYGLDGAFNVENISNADINNDILIYYKNVKDNKFFGGITYRARVEGGLKAGEVKQVMTKHYSPENSLVMFVGMGAQ